MLDYIIVGFGLGGACTSFMLEKESKSFMVLEDGSQTTSKVAGGVMNPVILKRFTLAWNADEQLRSAKTFYNALEEHLGLEFMHPVEIYRRFSSVEEQNNWFSAADKPGLASFIDTNLKPSLSKSLPGEHSFGRVRKTARVDTRKLLDSYTDYLQKKRKLTKERFQYENLKLTEDGVEYQGIKARQVIFCEGFSLLRNPYFKNLPMQGNKGEYIIIKSPELQLDVVVKSSVFVSPLGNDLYAVGATYNNQDKTPLPTPEARKELQEKLEKLITVPYEVVDQVAGLRPSTGDRRPFVGQHPLYNQLYVCNGFGSRGVLIAPAASRELLEFIEKGKAISEEMDIIRFRKRLLRD